MDENNTNKIPRYKIGQVLTYAENVNHKGFEVPVKVSGAIIKIEIMKSRLHLKYESPNILYTMRSENDKDITWSIDEHFLINHRPHIDQGYAVDDKENQDKVWRAHRAAGKGLQPDVV